MNNTALNIRISEDLKSQIDSKAAEDNLSSSEVARQILEDYFYQSEEEIDEDIDEEILRKEKEYDKFVSLQEDLIEKEEDILYTPRFIQLICWIYDRKSNTPKYLGEKQYKEFEKTLYEINSAKQISDNLKKEFGKVLAELIQRNGNFLYRFEFTTAFGSKRFDYEKLNQLVFDQLKKGEVCDYSV